MHTNESVSTCNEAYPLSRFEAFKAIFYVFILVTFCSIFGALTRPATGALATIWPGNALLLGLFLRRPQYNKWYVWIAAYTAYILADLYTGNELYKTLAINIVNVVGIATGFFCYTLIPSSAYGIVNSPQSVLRYFLIITVIALVCGIFGAIINPLVFKNLSALEGFQAWFTGEMVNYMTILPIVLTFYPKDNVFKIFRFRSLRKYYRSRAFFIKLLPAIALAASLLLTHFISGPGSIAFAVPTLLWCSISYGLFTMSILNTIFSFWTLLSLNSAHEISNNIYFGPENTVISIRIGVALITLAPILVCSIMKSRNDLMNQLEYYATHDYLTTVLNRSGIDRKYHRYRQENPNSSTGFLLLDIDFFKVVNDTYGHDAGDITLKEFTQIISRSVRKSDIFGRIGGEEFGLIIPFCTEQELNSTAQKICKMVGYTPIRLSDTSTTVNITVSIGGVFTEQPYEELDMMFSEADKALYYVKNGGRNCWKINRYDPPLSSLPS